MLLIIKNFLCLDFVCLLLLLYKYIIFLKSDWSYLRFSTRNVEKNEERERKKEELKQKRKIVRNDYHEFHRFP